MKQEKDGCGAAVVAMVMQYWAQQRPKSADESPASDAAADPVVIQQALYSAKAKGIYASDMERYLQKHGFRTFVFRATWDDLKSHLEKGRPLIVALRPVPGEKARHYVVLAGLDWEQSLVLVNDPAQKKLIKEERSAFEKEWAAVGRWTLLVVPE
ncbi:MAG: C39 family peptidase [Acidobacteriia bacterium]|nr:C39 family peptidase [Terriglobia bacterium]